MNHKHKANKEASAEKEQIVGPDETEQLRQELVESNERYLRTLADFDNTRKRLIREKEEFSRFASEAIVRELLPILDSLDQAIAGSSESDPNLVSGLKLIRDQFLALMKRHGVERIATVGELFDPHLHEAVAQVEAENGLADHHVVEELHVGYTMHGKVIRPAMVKVAIAKDETSNNNNEEG